MSFLAPFMMWGALAAGIPIALHFFFKSRYRKVPWAAMKFLLTSIEQTSRRLKFQELLLLLLRVVVLVLLALALARPSFSVGRSSGAGDAVEAVLLIDNSMSMDAREGAKTRLAIAKEAALATIDHLPSHSTVQILTTADRATLLGPRDSADLDQARRLVESIDLTHLGTDFLPGMTEALCVLERGQAANKELYLYSDMQKLGWAQQSEALTGKLQEITKKANIYLVRCGKKSPRNVTLASIIPQSGIPHTGERAAFAVLVRNPGTQPVRDLKVSLMVDGKASDKEAQPIPELGPGETRTVTLTAKLDHPGLRVLTAIVKDDELEADNRLDLVIHVRDQVRILVVDGAPNAQEPEKSASFFLLHGLLPVKDADKSKYHVQPRLVTPRQAAPSLLADKDLCILVNVPLQSGVGENREEPLSREFVDQLTTFIREGHGLLIFGGDRVASEPYNRILGKEQGLLPLPLAKKSEQDEIKTVHPDRSSATGRFFSLLGGDEYYKGLNGIEVRRYLLVEEPSHNGEKGEKGEKDSTAGVLLRYNDGKPALVNRHVGAGEVLMVTTSADVAWTDWPLWKGMYVPFLDLVLNHLLHEQTQNHNLTAGEALRYYPPDRDATRNFAMIKPNGDVVRLGPPEMDRGRPVVTANETPVAGIYRIALDDEANRLSKPDEKPGVPFAVVYDARETEDLETLSDAQIDERIGTAKVIHATAGDEAGSFTGSERLNHEWTLWILGAVLMLAVGETALAWICGRAW